MKPTGSARGPRAALAPSLPSSRAPALISPYVTVGGAAPRDHPRYSVRWGGAGGGGWPGGRKE
ncbi:hypothetical protein E2C01_062448 [Portunus trituberculatus]|uniref:Uncharacterized protein n=1 Tax=Portunus trituberculatus TaxID=210409 RepID=A0A5B7H7W8_PORTR|nr:hypothetical protein [Portunus trituberculatus]